MPTIAPAAARGFSAGAEAYARGRPDYPLAMVGWLEQALGLARGQRVLDLGAGGGKFLPSLKATGATVVAVEPVAEMRAELARAHPNVEALEGTAEAIPLPDQSVDAVVCATAFHWFASEAALAEIRRVLKVKHTLGLVWNVRDERVNWVVELTNIIKPYEGDAMRYGRGEWRRLFPGSGFGPLSETRFENPARGPAEDVIVTRTLSTSFIAALGEDERSRVADRIRALIAATPALAGKAKVVYPYVTAAYASMRLD